MPQSPSSAPLSSISKGCFDKSAYYSSLPWFRRCLAILNWRPVVDYELREIEFDRREIEYEQRMQQLQKESEQLKIEDEQSSIAHEQKMRQLDELDSKLDALLCSSSTSSTPPQSTPDNSEA
jgi:hypothetical protein